MRQSNEEVHKRANMETISEQVRRRRWTWIGHVLRMDTSSLPRVALTWAPEEKHKRGRPTETWRRTVKKERMTMGYCSWVETELVATDKFWPHSPYGVAELMMMLKIYSRPSLIGNKAVIKVTALL